MSISEEINSSSVHHSRTPPGLTTNMHLSDHLPIKKQIMSSVLSKHILSGYWHNWHATPASFMPLRNVQEHFDVINVAFATPANDRSGRIQFKPYSEVDETQFVSDIAYLQSLGKKVLISIGGANGLVSIETPDARNNFTNSIIEIIHQYGFDGIDINLEGKVRLAPGDVDFRNPISASIRHLITAIREIRGNFGPDFILSLAPESINVQGGFRTYSGLSGSYLPVIHGLRDILTYLQVQHYNAGQLDAGDHNNYAPGTADFHVAMADILLQGFFVQDDPSQFFPPLQPEQVVIGLAASPSAVNNGYSSLAETEKALRYLMKGDPFGGRYVLSQASGHSSLRGIMTWSINWDAVDCGLFSEAMHSFLRTLP